MAFPSETIGQLRLAAQRRADMENDGAVSDAEWNAYINDSLGELYDLMVSAYGPPYFATTYSVTTTATDTYALPAGCYKPLSLEVLLSGSDYATLKPMPFAERNNYPGLGVSGRGPGQLRYCFVGTNILVRPQPAAGQTLRLWFVPQMTPLLPAVTLTVASPASGDYLEITNPDLSGTISRLTAGTDFAIGATNAATTSNLYTAMLTLFALNSSTTGLSVLPTAGSTTSLTVSQTTLVVRQLSASNANTLVWSADALTKTTGTTFDGFSGWTEYVIVDAAIKAMVKDKTDPSALFAQKAALVKRIEAMAANRDAGAPSRVVDVYAESGEWPDDDGRGW